MSDFCNFKNMDPARSLELRDALKRIVADRKISEEQLAAELGVSTKTLNNILNGTEDSIEPWIAIQGRIIEVLRCYNALPQDDIISPNIVPVFCADADSTDEDPFAESAEDVAAEETRDKVLLFAWADSVLGLSEAELELELDRATKRFNHPKALLRRIIKARRNDKKRPGINRAGIKRTTKDRIPDFTAMTSNRPVRESGSGASTAMGYRAGIKSRRHGWTSMPLLAISVGKTGAHMSPSPIGTVEKRSSPFPMR
jgi:transcriptional regulator with XRE-family HTH domain